ncbi:divergent polysaccharide deacetylase family protein [Bacillus carboniphilus]|uniref:divergent polysaccharide deacetylase family protein n=1 Tax=Bacillus carboniphilus TaxID=86663 RepID=UPI003531AC01
MNLLLRILIVCFCLHFFYSSPIFAEEQKKEFAIVIDDLGNNMKGTEEMLKLPVSLTVAIMPFMPSTLKDAKTAHRYGHEVIIHMPMEPNSGKVSWLGPGAITTSLSDQEIRSRVRKAIDQVPHAVGMNHHMGSKATANKRVMRIVLEECKKNGLYYLDSKTTSKSVISEVASELGVPYLENKLFFDHLYTKSHITKQANLLEKRLQTEKDLVAIGHVGISGPVMVSVLKQFLPKYKKKATPVLLSELLPEHEFIDGNID